MWSWDQIQLGKSVPNLRYEAPCYHLHGVTPVAGAGTNIVDGTTFGGGLSRRGFDQTVTENLPFEHVSRISGADDTRCNRPQRDPGLVAFSIRDAERHTDTGYGDGITPASSQLVKGIDAFALRPVPGNLRD